MGSVGIIKDSDPAESEGGLVVDRGGGCSHPDGADDAGRLLLSHDHFYVFEEVVVVVAGVVGGGYCRNKSGQSVVDLEDGRVPLLQVIASDVDGEVHTADRLDCPQVVGDGGGHADGGVGHSVVLVEGLVKVVDVLVAAGRAADQGQVVPQTDVGSVGVLQKRNYPGVGSVVGVARLSGQAEDKRSILNRVLGKLDSRYFIAIGSRHPA